MEDELHHLNKMEKEVISSFVRELKEKLGDEILSIRLFGSKVRGDFHKESDIDILIRVKGKSPVIGQNVSDLSPDYVFDYDIPFINRALRFI